MNIVNRRELLQRSGVLCCLATISSSAAEKLFANSGTGKTSGPDESSVSRPLPLNPPAKGSIPVAFVLSEGAVVIDFCGPWAVLEMVAVPGRSESPFQLYTVAEAKSPIRVSGGMKVVPEYTFDTAPAPKMIVIPAQNGSSEAMLNWIRTASKSTDITMSVCTGAFILAQTGLLSGKAATTHHAAYFDLAAQFPDIQVKRGARFVEAGNLATAGGLSSGIDLALRVVERYFGPEVAAKTALNLEYQGQGWTDPNSNGIYARRIVSTAAHPVCLVCGMEVDPATSPRSTYKEKVYYFCSEEHRVLFDKTPETFVEGAIKE